MMNSGEKTPYKYVPLSTISKIVEAHARLHEAHAVIDALEARLTPQPIETAPEARALLLWGCYTVPDEEPTLPSWIIGWPCSVKNCWVDEAGDEILNPTHWLPLPEAPK